MKRMLLRSMAMVVVLGAAAGIGVAPATAIGGGPSCGWECDFGIWCNPQANFDSCVCSGGGCTQSECSPPS